MSHSIGNTERSARMIDVARLAGVSQQTVSRVVNNQDNVTPEVRERVEVAIRRLNYRRNRSARALATSRTHSLGIVSYGLAQFGPSVALTGIVDEARRSGYTTSLVALVDVGSSHLKAALDHLVADSVDGIIVIAPIEAALHSVETVSTGVPLVVFEPGAVAGSGNVGTDEVRGAALATRHLIELGHATVHHLAGPDGWLGTTARLTGWRQELVRERLPVPEPLVGDWTTRSGYAAGLRIAGDAAITAVFVANDQMALGVIKGLDACGLSVPDDVSVVGFDDLPESAFFRPSLTTVRIDFEAVGRLSASTVIAAIHDGPVLPAVQVDPAFVHRSSTAPPSLPRRTASPP